MISDEQHKWFSVFWKYVRSGTYQQFIRDLQKKRNPEEVDNINLQIRKVYLSLMQSDPTFNELGRSFLASDGSTIIVENSGRLKLAVPTFVRLMVGNHGIYLEFTRPEHCGRYVKRCKQYIWYEKDFAKYYCQTEPVNYADYKVGMWYVSLYEALEQTDPDYVSLLCQNENPLVN
jgi:hypothetical protein